MKETKFLTCDLLLLFNHVSRCGHGYRPIFRRVFTFYRINHQLLRNAVIAYNRVNTFFQIDIIATIKKQVNPVQQKTRHQKRENRFKIIADALAKQGTSKD